MCASFCFVEKSSEFKALLIGGRRIRPNDHAPGQGIGGVMAHEGVHGGYAFDA